MISDIEKSNRRKKIQTVYKEQRLRELIYLYYQKLAIIKEFL